MFWLMFTIFLCACLAAGTTGGAFPPGTWYDTLKKPAWTPPNWVFPVTWMVLYLCMSLAAARVAQAPGSGIALALWSLQIALNTLWTPVFFGLRNIRMGMAVLVGLWISVFLCMIALWQIDGLAGLLFVPYLIWVTIAASLNGAVWMMNPDQARGTG